MISFQQIRRFFVTIILTIMLAITIAFDFGTTGSWAATLPTQIATMNRVEAMTKDIEGKAQEAIGNMTDDSPTQEAKRFKAETLEGIKGSIGKSGYQPGGKTKQTEKQNRESTEEIKAEASEAMDSYLKE